jgi:hypothetical protein
MTITFRCGHTATLTDRDQEAPVCACGERKISRCNAPAPKFRGTASGPHVTTTALSPITVSLGTQTLTLKENDHA